MSLLTKKSISILLLLALLVGNVSATPYYVDQSGNTWFKTTLNGETQHFYVKNVSGFSPSPEDVFIIYDDFNGQSLNSTLWDAQQRGTSTGTISVSDGALTLAGQPGVVSSANVILNHQFTNNTELILRQSLEDARYSDVAFGAGDLKATGTLDSTSWWHTQFSTDGCSFFHQGLGNELIFRNADAPTTPTSAESGDILSNYVTENSYFTQAFGYTQDGEAYTNILDAVPTGTTRLKLNIPTYDGSGQAVHPDVYYNSTGLWGYKYWMAMTPYKNSLDKLENPSLLCSNDKLNWYVPKNITNPLSPSPTDGSHGADTDLVYNPIDNKLYIYWVNVQDTGNTIRMRTFDGENVSDEYIITGITGKIVSPAVILDDGTYYMYVVDTTSSPYQVVLYSSPDGINFANPQNIQITQIDGKDIWHINVEKYGNGLREYVAMGTQGTYGANGMLYFGESSDYMSPWTLNPTPLITPRAGYWDGTQIYRSSGLSNDTGIDIWYSASTSSGHWGIGYMRFDNTLAVSPIDHTTVSCIPIASYFNNTYVNDTKKWLISQGEYSNGYGGPRHIDCVMLRKCGADPTIYVEDLGYCKKVTVVPLDDQIINDYTIKIPANMLSASNSMYFDSKPPTTALFSSNYRSGTAPLTVKFHDESVGNPTSWKWDFENDGIIDSTKRNPVHVYGKPGIYSVNLTVANKYGTFNELKTDYVTVTSPAFASDPVAWFNWILSYITSMHVAFWGANY